MHVKLLLGSTKNCNVMIRLNDHGRPAPIMNTLDLLKLVPNYKPSEFILCVDPLSLFSVPNFSPVSTPSSNNSVNHS